MTIHKNLSEGRWFEFSLAEQMANIGCDVARAINWKKRNNVTMSQAAFERSLELFDFTLIDPKNRGRGALKEVARAREFWVDFYMYNNMYNFTEEFWNRYFLEFNYLAALQRGK